MRISDWSSDVCSPICAYDRIGQGAAPAVAGSDPLDLVRREIERWRNHFADLDAAAELLADELRLGAGDLYGAVAERLRAKRSEERRVGKERVRTCRLRWSTYH